VTEDITNGSKNSTIVTIILGIIEKRIWRKKCGQQDTSTAGGRWRRQHRTELDRDKWSVDYYMHRWE